MRNIAFVGSDKHNRAGSGAGSDGGDSAEEVCNALVSILFYYRLLTIRQGLTRGQDFYGTVVTEVQITSDSPVFDFHELPAAPIPAHTDSILHCGQSWVADIENRQGEAVPKKPQQFETTCSSDSHPAPQFTVINKLRAAKSSASLKLRRLDPVKMAYLRTSFIFGFAVLITWIPSSINRLYSLTNGGRVSFQLSVASGCVLPLQGVWNALIYFSTSWNIVRDEIKIVRARLNNRKGNNFLGTTRLESRLDVAHYGHRNTLERPRMTSVKVPAPAHFGFDDIELHEHFRCERNSV